MNRIIMHIDVNNAFLSWSAIYLLNNGFKYDIRNRYAIIGGDKTKRKGIVLAKSPLAKTKGIVTAETIYSARRKCPNLEIYPGNYEWYIKMSKSLFNLLENYTNEIEIFSIDECFLDYTKVQKLYGDPIKFAYKLKKEIFTKLGFTVNIGIANNKLCAKMASDFIKPNRVHTLFDEEVKSKMYPLDISELFGIGKKTSEKLRTMNIKTIGDLANADLERLTKIFKNQALVMINSAKGIDDSPVVYWKVESKGIGNEITLEEDVEEKEEVYKILLAISEHLGMRIRKIGKNAQSVSIIIKDNTFKRYSHQKKVINPISSQSDIYEVAKEIYDEMNNNKPIRLIGIRLDKLTNSNIRQLSIFEQENKHIENKKLDQEIDKLQNKYGDNIIRIASINEKNMFKKRLK